MNWIYQKIRDQEHGSIAYGMSSIIVGLFLTILLLIQSYWILYCVGAVLCFLVTSSIDCSYKPSIMTGETEMRRYLVGTSFIWPGHVAMLTVTVIITVFLAILQVLMNLHSILRSFKITLPKRKIKTMPMPNSDPYRSPPVVCESCGKEK